MSIKVVCCYAQSIDTIQVLLLLLSFWKKYLPEDNAVASDRSVRCVQSVNALLKMMEYW